MRITLNQLRRIIQESVINHMREQDRDGDGDKDFDDVRMARMVNGGMSPKAAKAKVKSKPMGNKEVDESRRKKSKSKDDEIDYSVFDKYDADAVGDALIKSDGSISKALDYLESQYDQDDDDFSWDS